MENCLFFISRSFQKLISLGIYHLFMIKNMHVTLCVHVCIHMYIVRSTGAGITGDLPDEIII